MSLTAVCVPQAGIMSFSSLRPSGKPASIHGSDSESEPPDSEASGAAAAADAGGFAVSGAIPVASVDRSLDAATLEDCADEAPETVEVAPTSSSAPGDAGAPAGRRRRVHGGIWGQHSGYGICGGLNQLPCCFGDDGGPANAAACGRCDLCSGDALRLLHNDMPQRITHLLCELDGKPLAHACWAVLHGETTQNDDGEHCIVAIRLDLGDCHAD